jgi:thymidylate synthase
MAVYKNEIGYMWLIEDILRHGVEVPDRTGVGCIALFDAKVMYDQFPFSTYRPAPLRMAFEEFWMFIRGETQTKYLEEKGINFWKGNTSREFLDKRGLTHLVEGDMGKGYGFQFRNFGQGYTEHGDEIYGVDQLKNLYEGLKNDPYGRRHYVTFWNPQQSDEMALTPCHHSHQFVALPDGDGNDVLHLKLLNRSLDSVFGFLYASQQYYLYMMAMAKLLNMKVGRLSVDLTHVHIYNNQIEYANELLTREIGKPGKVTITKELNTLDDLISMEWSDILVEDLLVNTTPFKTPRPPMAV